MSAPRNRIASRDAKVRGLGAPTPDDIAAHHARVQAHEKAAAPLPKVSFEQVLAAHEAPPAAAPQPAQATLGQSDAGTPPDAQPPVPPWRSRRLMRG